MIIGDLRIGYNLAFRIIPTSCTVPKTQVYITLEISIFKIAASTLCLPCLSATFVRKTFISSKFMNIAKLLPHQAPFS